MTNSMMESRFLVFHGYYGIFDYHRTKADALKYAQAHSEELAMEGDAHTGVYVQNLLARPGNVCTWKVDGDDVTVDHRKGDSGCYPDTDAQGFPV